VGSENGNLVGHAQTVRREGVVHGGSGVHLRQRADRFLERLFPTATDERGSGATADRGPADARISPLAEADRLRLGANLEASLRDA
jgi:hypothetical protein